MSFSNRLKSLREAAKESQSDLALKIGTSTGIILNMKTVRKCRDERL